MIDVIIPCYNDYLYLSPIVKVALASKNVSKVIVVDDGSNHKTKQTLQKIKNIVLITHSKNKGKTAAITSGVQASTADYVLLLDADLQNMKTEYIDQ